MASLTEVAYNTKKIFKIGGILIVAFIILKIVYKMGLTYWQKAHPPAPPPPAMRFGKIPKLSLDKMPTTTNYKFNLETPTNTLPALSDRADIYYSPFSKPNLLALERAKKQALLLDFTGNEQKITEKKYRWQNKEENTTLEMNIFNGTFTLKYNWKQDQNLLSKRIDINEENAIIKAKQILAEANLTPNDTPKSNIKTTYMKISGQKIVPSVSQSEANLIKVDFYRMDIDELPVHTIVADTGIIQIVLADTRIPHKGIIEMRYFYFPIDYAAKSDYPLRHSAELWNQLNAGGGYVISAPKNNVRDITIRRVYLGYVDTLLEQKFFQPVLFFRGDNDFLGFVPALNEAVYQ